MYGSRFTYALFRLEFCLRKSVKNRVKWKRVKTAVTTVSYIPEALGSIYGRMPVIMMDFP
jgi:hypothetical protein